MAVSACLPSLHGQVFEITGGSSSLYQAQGGSVTVRGPNLDASIGAGLLAGALVGGANITRVVGKSTYIAGDDYVPFVLPTDIFDTSHYLVAVGAGLKTKMSGADVFGLAGAISNDFSSPFFEGVRAESPAGILFVDKALRPNLTISSRMVFSAQTTAIQSLDWKPAKDVDLAVSCGAGASQPYGAGSLSLSRRWIDIKAAYIEAGPQFHRVAIQMPILSEPDRENVVVTVRPGRYLSLSGGRQNFLTPIGSSTTEVKTTVNEGSANLLVARTGLSASLYQSTYLGSSDVATSYTADRDLFSRVHATVSYFESESSNTSRTRDFVTNLTETLSPRLNVTEMINRSQGQTTVSFGGGLLTNLVSISAEYQTYYVPLNTSSPFEQALILDGQLHLFHGITLHGATFVAPDGSTEYTADGQAIAVRQEAGSGGQEGGILAGSAIGSKVIQGRVTDPSGRPVAGAAVMIDKLEVYTDDEGAFFVRERKVHSHLLQVQVDKFLDGRVYRVVSAPSTIRSAEEGREPETVIVVERVAKNSAGSK